MLFTGKHCQPPRLALVLCAFEVNYAELSRYNQEKLDIGLFSSLLFLGFPCFQRISFNSKTLSYSDVWLDLRLQKTTVRGVDNEYQGSRRNSVYTLFNNS